MRVLIAYDVVIDRRRTRLFKFLRRRLEHVQKSVFEGELPEEQLAKLQARMLRLIDPVTDSVRVYRLCRRCIPAIEVLGVGSPLAAPEDCLV